MNETLSVASSPDPTGSERRPQDEFRAMPLRARTFVGATVLFGIASLVVAVSTIQLQRPGLFIELLALAIVTSTVKVSLPLSRSGSTMSLSFAITLAALIILGAGDAVLIGMLSAWTQCTFRMKARNPLHRTLFSIASVGLAIHAAGLTFDLVRQNNEDFLLGIVRPIGPATTVYFFVNTFLVAGAVALSTKQTLRKVWMSSFLWSAPSYFVAAGAASVAAVVARQGSYPWGALVAVPLYLTYRSYRIFIARIEEERAQVRQLSDVQLSTIEALALAIEVKDRTSQTQVRRMQVYAEGLARAMGMPEEEIPGVKTAALLHDIGHLAVPEHILGKPGPLTYEEFERVKIHSRVGADILAAVPFPYPVAPLILSHHERWNGTGYPAGLSALDIPKGARVLAVADTFTSLLFDRPYRKARTYSEAIATLRESAGVNLDPTMVETFIEILPVLEVAVQRQANSARLADTADPALRSLGPTALENIAGAHREAKVLYEIAQALGTSLGVEETITLISEKLQGLLPFSCCALFLRDRATGYFSCRVAVGTAQSEVWAIGGASLEWLAGTLPQSADGEPQLKSALVFPLVAGTHTLGAFALYAEDADAYDHEHRRVLEQVTRQAAPVIQNALVFEETQEASLTDPLTGLANRRALQQHLAKELTRADREHGNVTVLLLDMDGLKFFNDHYGHHTGDRAIREVAQTLPPLLRSYDMCARFAGDEFVISLWDCDAEEGDTRRRELQQAVAAISFDVARGKSMTLGLSAGAATFPEDGTTVDELLSVADTRMYKDKIARKGGAATVLPLPSREAPPVRAAS